MSSIISNLLQQYIKFLIKYKTVFIIFGIFYFLTLGLHVYENSSFKPTNTPNKEDILAYSKGRIIYQNKDLSIGIIINMDSKKRTLGIPLFLSKTDYKLPYPLEIHARSTNFKYTSINIESLRISSMKEARKKFSTDIKGSENSLTQIFSPITTYSFYIKEKSRLINNCSLVVPEFITERKQKQNFILDMELTVFSKDKAPQQIKIQEEISYNKTSKLIANIWPIYHMLFRS